MGVSAKDILKDNKKMFIPLGILLVLVVIVTLSSSAGFDIFETLNISQHMSFTEAENVLQDNVNYGAIIKTNQGDIQIDLYENEVPVSVNNFVFLSSQGFYNGLTFHKVISGFIIQAGDPNADSTGDPGYTYADIITEREMEPYSVAMANAGDKNSNGSQFFIVCGDGNTSSIDGKYTIIGEITGGFVVVDAIEKATVDENYKPINDITIQSVQILED